MEQLHSTLQVESHSWDEFLLVFSSNWSNCHLRDDTAWDKREFPADNLGTYSRITGAFDLRDETTEILKFG